MAYSKEQLRNIFQNKFDREAWKAIVVDIFGANKVRRENELFTDEDDTEVGYYMGSIDTTDSYRIGLFYYKINSGSVAHKKVGLRNLVRKFINQNWGEFDAAIVVFDDNKDWRLSFVCDIKEEATTPKRFTYVFGENDNFYRTAIERFTILQGQKPTFENIRRAFSVDALSNDFFNDYRDLYADFVQYITGKRYVKEKGKWEEKKLGEPNYQYDVTFGKDDKLVRDYIKKMFGRIVFLYFLQRKGWLDGNRQYMHDLFYDSTNKENFLDGVLEPLFFEVLNTDKHLRTEEAKSLPGSENIPYLNGGLFARDEIDALNCVFPESLFKQLFDFLDSYNFTIDENDSEDAEVGIDPEMLGRIFENLLEDNKDKGAFYTPKEIVDYMCRESIIAYLLNGVPDRSHALIRKFVETFDASELTDEQKLYIRKKLQLVKICDPAIGSGAFPMGLVNLLSKLYVAMKADTDTAKMKRHIMEQNIYGVDIEQGAVDIARLRFWLAMIVEEKEAIPLPNLHFKIMQGNSLLESYNGANLADLTKISGQSSLFDSDNSEREALISSLKSYYKTSDHAKRDKLFNDIINNVRRQLFDKGITLQAGKDPSANSDFFLWHTWFTDVFTSGGFDIVIGNPPYIQLQKSLGITAIDKKGKEYDMKLGDLYKDANFATFEKTGDIYCLFYELGNKMLKDGGHLCYITSNKWMRAGYGESLRSYLSKSTNPKILIDFGGIQIFDSATVDTNILLIQKAKNQKSTMAVTASKHDKTILNNLSDFVQQNASPTEFNSSDSWVVLTPIELSIKRKIESVGVPLKDWDIQINYGIKTGFNDAFIVTTETRDQILANCKDDDERERTAELIRPILRGRDIKRYGYEWANLWLINTHNGIKGKLDRIHIEDYPAVKAHLDQYWDKISTRADKGDTPYNLRNCAYLDDFNKPKIIWGEISDRSKFSFDKNGQYVPEATTFLLVGNNIQGLYAFLNSSPAEWYFSKLGPRTGEGTIRWKKYTVEQIFAPHLSELQMSQINYILSDKLDDIAILINEWFYEFYGFSQEEIQYINDYFTAIVKNK